MDRVELFLFGTAVLLILCVLLSKASGKVGIPTLVVFLAVGILAGSEGIGGIYFDNAYYAKTLGVVALSYILFSGGLDTKWSLIKPVMKSGLSLATLGVFLNCLFVGVFAHYLLGLAWTEGFLIGAIVSSTDAGAVFTVLRSKNIHLKRDLRSLLELESGSNDPMAVFLVTSILIIMVVPEYSKISLVPRLLQQMILGLAVGYSAGRGMAWGFNRLKLEFEGLYTVLSLAMVLIIYTTSQALDGNGFLSVYVAGVVLANQTFVFKKTLILLHDGVSWLMQSSMFLTLGLLIFPTQVFEVTGHGVLLAGFMIFVARPLSVFISLSFSELNWREKTFISWVGLRGAVPVVMATFPLVAGIAKAEYIFNLVFFVSVTSLLIQGTSISFVAKLLNVYLPEPETAENQGEYAAPATLRNNMSYVTIPNESQAVNKSIVDLKLPQDLLIVLIERKGEVIIPRGATELKASDKLMVIAQKESLTQLKEKL
ncbi:MAG: potassium/proton antiporter [Bacteriovoracia bacterium]